MNRILLLFAHPALDASRVHRALLGAARAVPGVTVHDLYEAYPDFDVDVTTETLRGNEEKEAKAKEKEEGRFHVIVSREMVGKINGGGPEILFKTFNGDVLLRRAKN